MLTVSRIAKAIAGLLVPIVGGVIAAVQDVSPGGSAITGGEWLTILLVAVTTGGVVFGVPNAAPATPTVVPPSA